jgi:hypothetical protein
VKISLEELEGESIEDHPKLEKRIEYIIKNVE